MNVYYKKKLTYCLLVTGAPYGTQMATNAWRFANFLFVSGHILKTVFFYKDGVYNGNQLNSPASDEFDLLIAWKKLMQKTGCTLNVCVAAALRRGVVNDIEAKHIGLYSNLDKNFVFSGLTNLVEAMLICDRTVQF
ncbi:MAG: sulfurtransferase complex subunit TusD [Arsenophonus sp.]|nr:MAG: sulfurtransferase complex subunit TusD [Arsenophonus sp.]